MRQVLVFKTENGQGKGQEVSSINNAFFFSLVNRTFDAHNQSNSIGRALDLSAGRPIDCQIAEEQEDTELGSHKWQWRILISLNISDS